MANEATNTIHSADLSAELVRDLIKERRRDRRWRNLRFFAGLVLVSFTVMGFFVGGEPGVTEARPGAGKGYVALIRLNGLIAPDSAFSAEKVVPQLEEAFADKDAKGVVLAIDSGGGTPVQAAIIHDEILQLKQKYHKKVVVVGEDLLASGAYFVAVSADKIFVNASTVTGSIGVIMASFGFPEVLKKIGIERRVYTAGDHKDRLDAFLPQGSEDTQKIHRVLDAVHDNFIQAVKLGRQDKLTGDTKELFSGDFWTGSVALQLGLVDGVGDLWDVMQKEFKVGRYKDYSAQDGVLKSVMTKMGSFLNLPLQTTQMRLFTAL